MTPELKVSEVPPDAISRRKIEEEEMFRLLTEEQHREEDEGAVPATPPTILQRHRDPLEYLGGILLGINIAVITIIFNFILFNWLLHMEF